MLYAIAILTIAYVVFRILTSLVIPSMTRRSIRRYEEKFRRDNPHIFEKRDSEAANKKDEKPQKEDESA